MRDNRESAAPPKTTHERLSAALRAQALVSAGTAQPAGQQPEPVNLTPRLPTAVLFILAVLLGAAAGALSGVISVW